MVHSCSINIGKDQFDDYFDKFRDIGHRMDMIFFQKTNYEYEIAGHKFSRMDKILQTKYENAIQELENVKLRYEKKPIKFFWGESFDRSLTNLRSILKDEQTAGRCKIRVQIIFQNEDDINENIDILNSLRDEINEGLSGIELKHATKGSIVLNVDILQEMMKTDKILQTTLVVFLGKILERISTSRSESIDIILLPVEEYTQWNVSQTLGETVYLDFDIEAHLFKTDNTMEDQLRKISEAIFKHSNGSRSKKSCNAILLPINLENISTQAEAFAQAKKHEESMSNTEEAFAQTQIFVRNILSVSVNLRQQLNIRLPSKEFQNIYSCITIGNTFLFTDYYNNQLIIYNADGTDAHYISLSIKPLYITKVDSNTVAVSCTSKTILIINTCTGSVTSSIETSSRCYGIVHDENNLYVVIDNGINVMDLTGKFKHIIPVPSVNIQDISVYKDKLVCIDNRSIYCCSLDGKLKWQFKNDKFQDLRRVTTDGEGNVYVTDEWTNTVTLVLVSDLCNQYEDILTELDGLDKPCGIHFDKKENVLLVCNACVGKAFLFDIKKKLA